MIWRLARRNVWRKAGRLTSVTGFSKAREDACCIVQGSRARAAPRKGEAQGHSRGEGDEMRLSPLMTCDLRGRDAPRLKRLRRALREVKKPSRWYHDDPTDTGSLYRKRTIAGLDVCLDIIVNSPDGALVDSAKGFLCNARGLLPLAGCWPNFRPLYRLPQ